LKINISGSWHYVQILSFTSTTATINLSSTPQQATLSINEEKKFEVTNDNYYDIYVKLNSIINNKANLTIKSIYEKVPEEEQGKDEKEIATQEQKPQEAETPPTIRNDTIIWVIGVVVLIIILIVALSIVYKIREKNKNKIVRISGAER